MNSYYVFTQAQITVDTVLVSSSVDISVPLLCLRNQRPNPVILTQNGEINLYHFSQFMLQFLSSPALKQQALLSFCWVVFRVEFPGYTVRKKNPKQIQQNPAMPFTPCIQITQQIEMKSSLSVPVSTCVLTQLSHRRTPRRHLFQRPEPSPPTHSDAKEQQLHGSRWTAEPLAP